MHPIENSLSLTVARRIDAACDRFERDWRGGKQPRIEMFLDKVTGAERTALLRALLEVEVELRRQQGATPTVAEYEQRFPQDGKLLASIFSPTKQIQPHPAVPSTVDTSVAQQAGLATGSFHPEPEPSGVGQADTLPKQIGRFEIIDVLGSGAFGKVYRARDPQLHREVALKVPLAGTLKPEELERFLREARAAATIQHPNVCPVFEVGKEGDTHFIVMAYIAGKSLATHLKERKAPMAPKQVALVVRKLALALESAHKKGIVHRDLKPANIMFDRDRKDVIVMDFGLARRLQVEDGLQTQSGAIMGTPAYMSPEQADGDIKAISPASDVFSLGVILYELLCGQRPFQGSMMAVIGQILHIDPEPPSKVRAGVDPRLEAICLKALAKKPADRYASMKQMADALDEYIKGKETAQAGVSTAKDEAGETKGFAEIMAALSAERKADNAVAIEEAVRRAKTPLWVWLVACGFMALILLGGSIIFFFRTPTATVMINIDVDLKDKTLTFFLDGKEMPAAFFEKPVELGVGEHTLIVKRGRDVVRQYTFNVSKDAGPRIELKDQSPPPKQEVPTERSSPPAPAGRSDVELLQGVWDVYAEEFQGVQTKEADMRQMGKVITFEGNRMVIHRTLGDGNRRKIEGIFQFNPNATPKTWDFSGTHYDGKPTTLHGLYELNGNALRMAYGTGTTGHGEPNRPDAFRSALDNGHVVMWATRRGNASPAETGFVPLFNGKDLSGWKTHPSQPGNWRVKNGVLVGSGSDRPGEAVSHLYTERGDYRDFHLLLEVRINNKSNSGVYFRSPFGPNFGQPRNHWITGYNVKLHSPRLGGLLIDAIPELHRTSEITFRPSEWMVCEIIAQGNHFVVKLNGQITADYTDELKRYNSGHLVLQQHNAATVVEIRKIEIKELPPVPVAPPAEAGFVPLFNGKDLSGWSMLALKTTKNKNQNAWAVAPERNFLFARAGDFQELQTDRQYQNFTLQLEWRFTPGGGISPNGSGIVVRSPGLTPTGPLAGLDPQGIEIDLRSPTSQNGETGNMGTGCFLTYGTRLTNHRGKAYGQTQRSLGWLKEPVIRYDGNWNSCEITCEGDRIKVWMNGELVNEGWNAETVAGHICLRCQNTAVEFRNIRIKESTPPTSAAASERADGFVPLFNGKDLTGWSIEGNPAWRVEGGVLVGQNTPPQYSWLFTNRDYGDCILRCEFQGSDPVNSGIALRAIPGDGKTGARQVEVNIGNLPRGFPTGSLVWGTGPAGLIAAPPAGPAPVDGWHVLEVILRGQSLVATVNGREVLHQDLTTLAILPEALPGLKRSLGRIGLQAQNGVIRFRKVEIKDLSATAPAQ